MNRIIVLYLTNTFFIKGGELSFTLLFYIGSEELKTKVNEQAHRSGTGSKLFGLDRGFGYRYLESIVRQLYHSATNFSYATDLTRPTKELD